MKHLLGSTYLLTKAIIAGFCFILLFPSCIKEDDHKIKKDRETVTLSINVPSYINTRALDESAENKVSHIYVLLFDRDNSNTYFDKAEGEELADLTSTRKKFKVRLPKGNFDFMILVNCKNEVDGTTLTAGMSKSTVTTALTYSMSQWSYDPDAYTPFPMWGELENVEVKTGIDLSGKVIPVIRAVARIDVVLDLPFYTNGFIVLQRLYSVHLYNRYTDAQLVPTAGNYTISASDLWVSQPSIPSWANKTEGPLVYIVDQSAADYPTPNRTLEATIYTFESFMGSPNALENTCLVLGIGVDGLNGAVRSSLEGILYYRADFIVEDAGEDKLTSVLRNHQYIFTVTDLYYPGFPDPDKSYRSQQFDINYTVVPWQATYDYEIDSKNYRLDISSTSIKLDARIYNWTVPEEIRITTNHPEGWSYHLSNSPTAINTSGISWMDVQIDKPPVQDAAVTMSVTITQNNDTGQDRTAYIHVTAGNLTNIIKVVQSRVREE